MTFTQLTALLGSNGSGKSTILRALDAFYAGSPGITANDFYDRDTSKPIEIDLTFTALTPEERAMFASKIDADDMSVMRVFDYGGGKSTGRYYGTSLLNPDFSGIRAATGVDKRNRYNQLRAENEDYTSALPSITRIDQVDPALAEWEQKHPGRCQRARDDGQFFGFTSVANGKLQKATSFVFIPAVRDAAADAIDARGAAVARLMELVVRSAIEKKIAVQEFRARASEEYRKLMDPTNLPELGGLATDLTTTLKTYYQNAAVDLQWQPIDDLAVPPPNANVLLEEEAFRSPVERTGHGLQRAFILALLQHLALASSLGGEEEEVTELVMDVGSEDKANKVKPVLPGLILAIEEPELYQHPTKQRHFAKVLARLCTSGLPRVAGQMQIVFATHSALFVRMDEFKNIRLARRFVGDPEKPRETMVRGSSLANVCRLLEDAHAADAGTYTEGALKARLHIMNPEVCEGFFADLVVLVEGPSDRAALLAAAALDNVDLEAAGIAVIPCGSANNLDRPAAIFRELKIPTYIIWDGDAGGKDDIVRRNRALQKLLSVPAEQIVDAPSFVRQDCACFANKLESTLVAEIGADNFNPIFEKRRAALSLDDRNDALKVPLCITLTLKEAAEQGHRSKTLQDIVSAIMALHSAELPKAAA